MAIKGRYGYKNRKGEIGEISSTSINILRTGVATEVIQFGDFLEVDKSVPNYLEKESTGVRPYYDALAEAISIVGVAVYSTYSSDVKNTHQYNTSDIVSILTEGDIRLRVHENDECSMGAPCYATGQYGSYMATSVKLGSSFQIGTFAESGIATTENSFSVAIKISQDII